MNLLNSINEIIPNYQIITRARSEARDITQARMSNDIAQESRAKSQPRDITQARVSHDIAQESVIMKYIFKYIFINNKLFSISKTFLMYLRL